ncbi:hypothetical protein [Silvimonas amylolytica]|nr:hypothetical protein [Silvimonas amylolytica]
MDKNRTFPRTDFKSNQNDLMHAMYSVTATEIAEICKVDLDTVHAWKTGIQPVPYMAYQLLLFKALGRIPEGFGSWSGWTIIEDRIYPPGATYKGAARQIELVFIDHYRIDRQLCENQATHIEGLQRRHDFYKKQCGLEARWGMMINNLFG